MSQTTQTQITVKETPVNERDTPAVLAYRVGQLENSVKEGIGALSEKLDKMSLSFASQHDHDELAARVKKLENRDNFKSTLLWVGLVASAIINIVGAAKIFGA